jgi:hypothetical protein
MKTILVEFEELTIPPTPVSVDEVLIVKHQRNTYYLPACRYSDGEITFNCSSYTEADKAVFTVVAFVSNS